MRRSSIRRLRGGVTLKEDMRLARAYEEAHNAFAKFDKFGPFPISLPDGMEVKIPYSFMGPWAIGPYLGDYGLTAPFVLMFNRYALFHVPTGTLVMIDGDANVLALLACKMMETGVDWDSTDVRMDTYPYFAAASRAVQELRRAGLLRGTTL